MGDTKKSVSEIESKRRIAYLEALSQIQTEIAGQRSLDEIFDRVIQAATDIFGAAACAVLLLGPDGETFTCRASRGVLCSEYDKSVPSGQKRLAERVLDTGKVVAVADCRKESKLCLATLDGDKLPGAAAAAPIFVEQDRIVGVLEAYSDEPRTLDEEELHFLNTLAASVGISVSKSIIDADLAIESTRRIAYLEVLSLLQTEMASQRSLDEILDKVIEAAIDIMGAAACAVLLLGPDEQTFTCRASKGVLCSEYEKEVPDGKKSLAERVFRTHTIVTIDDCRAEGALCLASLENGSPPGAAVAAPILVEQNRLVGVLEVYSEKPGVLSVEELHCLNTLAGSVGVSVTNSNISADLQKQRTWLDSVLKAIPSAVFISLKPDDRLELANDRAEELLGKKLKVGMPLTEMPANYGISELDGSPIPLDRFPLYRASAYGEPSELIEMMILRPDGERSIVQGNALPMYDASGNVSGAVGELEDITRLKAVQTDLEKTLAKEHYLAETIQKALIPDIPDCADGLKIGQAYAAAYEEDYVGGDFFDVFSPNPEQIAIVIGDVAGKGVRAAVLTALVRHTLRAYSYDDPSPKHLMEKLNNVVASEVAPEEFITLFYALWDTKKKSLVYVNAGHEPPLYLAGSESEASELTVNGTPVGALADALYTENSLKLSSEDRLLFYTDGVTEARMEKDFFGLEAVTDFFVAKRHESPSDFAAQLMNRLKEYSNDHLRDDIAVLLISVS